MAKRLQPKVVIAENVKGLITGNAKGWVNRIISAFDNAGYDVQVFLFNAARMGVPQKRERVFFIAGRMKYRIRTDRCLADINERVTKKKSGFTSPINHDDEPVQTITAGGYAFRMCDGLLMTDKDIIRCQTFPEDYDFMGQSVQYVCGMSVPPVMMAKISEQVYRQWLRSVQNDR